MTTTIYTKVTDTKSFIQKAKAIHNDRYDYSKVHYINNSTKIDIICPVHGSFWQVPYSHKAGKGCPNCTGNKKYTAESFIQKVTSVHGDKYDYSNVNYIGSKDKVNIICPDHGSFWQKPAKHIGGQGCIKCGDISAGNAAAADTKSFIEKAKDVHGDRYDYSKVIYTKSPERVEIICHDHGVFWQIAGNHLNNGGCPMCSKSNYSKIAIRWLDSIGLDIQHAENSGEYRLPNTNFRVDGYCKETNTVYEFHGDVFHGNPDVYKPTDKCHPFDKDIAAEELYQKTIDRENKIKSLGYNLVVMWENEYKLNKRKHYEI